MLYNTTNIIALIFFYSFIHSFNLTCYTFAPQNIERSKDNEAGPSNTHICLHKQVILYIRILHIYIYIYETRTPFMIFAFALWTRIR